jgi:hypothetical protein
VASLNWKIVLVGFFVMSGCGETTTSRVPTLLSPYQGQATGAVGSPRMSPNSLRPEFRWTPVDGAAGYEIQIDGSCSVVSACAFTSPELDEKTTTTSFVPSADLPVSTMAPVGHRYFWRVSACDESGACTTWSRLGIVDVGRQRQDFNGDGYADLAVVARSNIGSALFVYFGGQMLPTSPGWTIRGDVPASGGTSVAFSNVLWMGDANADGFADLAVVVKHQGGPDTVRLYLGGASPAPTQAQEVSTSISSDTDVVSILSGDMNGDGFADLFQNYLGLSSVSEIVSFGPSFGAGNARSRPLGPAMVAACDFDSDGYADLVESDIKVFRGGPKGTLDGSPPQTISVPAGEMPIACWWNTNGLGGAGLVLSTGSGSTPQLAFASSPVIPSALACDGPLPALSAGPGSGRGGPPGAGISVTDVGDADGDGYGDLLVGDPLNNRSALFFGGCPIERVLELPGGIEFSGTPDTGAAVAATGDLDGDGFPDFAVANVFGGLDDFCTGEVYWYRGGPSLDSQTTPSSILTDPDHAATPAGCAEDGFGVSLD